MEEPKKGTYKQTFYCRNCGAGEHFEIPKGESRAYFKLKMGWEAMRCANCGCANGGIALWEELKAGRGQEGERRWGVDMD